MTVFFLIGRIESIVLTHVTEIRVDVSDLDRTQSHWETYNVLKRTI